MASGRIISDTFTFNNLRIVTQAIADAVVSDYWVNHVNNGLNPDPRKWLLVTIPGFCPIDIPEAARVLAANGITVLLAQSDSPTPAISYAVLNSQSVAEVVITASHNAQVITD